MPSGAGAGDVVIGSLIGVGAGQALAGLMDRLPPAPIRSRSLPAT